MDGVVRNRWSGEDPVPDPSATVISAARAASGSSAASVGRNAPDTPRIVYTPRKGATREGELAVLAAAYRFVLERREGTQGTDPGGRSTGRPEGSPEDRPAEDEGVHMHTSQ